ncbi:hypothetical protein C8J57DRAFT_1390956 [Mycena rebaudengoi]|nr:hypothetical protein C8J57DRAFT_1390956 [Mycena rebaudengoi]
MSVADLRVQLAEVDGLITQHRLLLEELEERRTSIRLQLDRVLYPVLTLPLDITSEIFIQCLPEPPALDNAHIDARQAPLILLHICKEWRRIALSLPALWATLVLDRIDYFIDESAAVVSPAGRISRSVIDSYDAWLAHARASRLSLYLNEISHEFLLPVGCSLLIRCASQLYCLEFHLDHSPALSTALSFPILQKLTVGIPEDDEETGVPQIEIKTFANAPQLREVTLAGGAFLGSVELPWGQLTTFTAEWLPVRECLEVFRLAPFLIECTLGVRDTDIDPNQALVLHSRLQKLRLTQPDFDFLQHLKLPALQDIHINEFNLEESTEDHWFLTMADFMFNSPVYAPLAGTYWFRVMPQLRDLAFHHPSSEFESDFLRLLDRTKEPDFLPHLSSLSFVENIHTADAELVHALSTRYTDDATKLLSFGLIWQEKQHVSSNDLPLAALRKLVERGMKIHFRIIDYAHTKYHIATFCA